MAFIVGPTCEGPVVANFFKDPWPSGERIRLSLHSTGGVYMTIAEATRLYESLGAALEAAGCTPVEVTVTDESEEAHD